METLKDKKIAKVEETFKKIYIHSEADLPKDDGDYFVFSKSQQSMDVYVLDDDTRPYFAKEAEWYLAPVEQIANEPTDEDIEVYFDKWVVKDVGDQDADIFSKGSLVRAVAIRYAMAMRDGKITAKETI